MDLCLQLLKESNKSRFDSYSVRKSVLIISHITFRDCRVHIFFDNLSRNICVSNMGYCLEIYTGIAEVRAQLFKGRLALNPGLNLTPVSFFLCSKVFSGIIFSVIFRASNHEPVDKKN